MTPQYPYEKIVDDIAAKIASGELAPGDKLPSLREMTEQYGVSAYPVRNAIMVLKTKGLIVGLPGSGVYVADQQPR